MIGLQIEILTFYKEADMKTKRITALALCLVMLFTLLPAAALAEDGLPEEELLLEEELELLPETELLPEEPHEEPEEIPALPEELPEELLPEELEEVSSFLDGVLTVTLLPGYESDSSVVYNSGNNSLWAASREAAQNGQFFQEGDYICFKLPDCPFSAPEGKSFEGWNQGAPGKVIQIQLTGNLLLTAQWRTDVYSLINNIPPAAGIDFWLHNLKWRVIGKSDTAWLVIADFTSEQMIWQVAMNCCNTLFDSFSGPEKAAVIPTTKTEGNGSNVPIYENFFPADLDNATLFLLSAAEVVTYFPSPADRGGGWWLRSFWLADGGSVGLVASGGSLGISPVSTPFSARPAFQMDPESILFTSAAKGGKSSAAAGSGAFGTFCEEAGGRKLTLLDSSRSGFSASISSTNFTKTITVTYSGAATGENNYVSAMLCDKDGNALYYASLTPASTGTGTWELARPSDLPSGTYTLKVFSEQQNANYYSDYASLPVSFTVDHNQRTVTFDANGGGGTMPQDSYFASEGKYTFPDCGFTAPEGMSFAGWSVLFENGFADTYPAGVTAATGLTGDITVSPIWQPVNIHVIVSPPGTGSAIYDGETFEATQTDAQAKCYVFDHWEYAENEQSEAPYGTVWPKDNPREYKNAPDGYYTAVFTAREYTVTVQANEPSKGSAGIGSSMQASREVRYGSTVTLTAAAAEGYKFQEWRTEPEDIVIGEDNTFTMPASNVTVTAVFVPENAPEFKSHTLLLSGEIGVNFYMDLSRISEADRENIEMEFTVNGRTQTDGYDKTCTNPHGDGYYGFTCFITSVEMADKITAVLKYGDGQTVSQTYSANQYVQHVLANKDNYSSSAVALVSAIADYGSYVQPFLAETNKWTVGTDHKAMDHVKQYTAGDVSAAKSAVSGYAIARDTGNTGIAEVKYSLNLQSETSIYLYLQPKADFAGSVTAAENGSKLTCVHLSDGRYRVTIPNIQAHQLGDTHTVTVSAGGEFTIKVSALSYVHTALNSSDTKFTNTAAQYAVSSLYYYYKATTDYKSDPNG